MMKYAIQLTLIFILALSIAGCEGSLQLTLYNRTGTTITLQEATSDHSTELAVPADSSVTLAQTFRGLLFHMGLEEADLPFDRLKIMTPADTIVARSRSEILALTRAEKTKYRKKTDHGFTESHRNFQVIIVRQ